VSDPDFHLHPPAARLLEGRRALVTGATTGIGGLDLLVNHAGIEKPFELVDMRLGRWGHVCDVADAVAWVSSDQQYIVGTTILVDGGMTLYLKFV
jgi:NAD(P)-dependent dehydrogenase (short-subunit alcohol dehydrogenase family)